MKLVIDASNIIVESGGFIHLKKILENFNNKKIEVLCVLASKETINRLKINNKKIKFFTHNYLNKRSRFHLALWRLFYLNRFLKKINCSILFILGGYFFLKKYPTIIIIQNLLPLMKSPDYHERYRTKIKNFILKNLYKFSVARSEGVIFLSKYSKEFFKKYTTPKIVIPHGIEKQFYYKKNIRNKKKSKFEILYVSKRETYKNHSNIVYGFHHVLKDGINARLTLVGCRDSDYSKSKLFNSIKIINDKFPASIIVKKLEKHKNIHKIYRKYDLHVFVSLCESFGIIILETIASSLPIITSNFPVFREILGKNTLYFNAKNPMSIFKTIKKYKTQSNLKMQNTKKLFKISKKYSWKNTSDKTFNFIYKNYKNEKNI